MTVLDPALRTVMDFASTRQVYGTTVAHLPYTRAVLAGVFTDLLTAEAGANALVSSRLHAEAMGDLSVIMGARGYLREGEHAAFGQARRALLAEAPRRESPGEFEHALVVAAHACHGRWRSARQHGGGFLGDSAWLRAVLLRVAGRRSGRLRPLPEELGEVLMAELTDRWAEGAGFGLNR